MTFKTVNVCIGALSIKEPLEGAFVTFSPNIIKMIEGSSKMKSSKNNSPTFIKLSPTELKFMEFIWKSKNGISSEEIYEYFSQARGTISTILYNLSKKKYVNKYQEGRHHIYKAQITKIEYEQNLIRQQLEKILGDSSFERCVATFCGKKSLTETQTKQLNQLLEEIHNTPDD